MTNPDRFHTFTDDALGDLDLATLVEHLQHGKVSSAELVDAAIARAEKAQPVLDALASADFDRARSEAAAPRAGAFSGVPTFVKDNADVAGLPTQQGTTSYVARPARADGDFARQFLGTGLVNLGKTQLSEFGFSASAEGRAGIVRNPWSTMHTAGASSAGSAAFVAAGVVPIAHANDGGGSIRIPAACTGLVGLKPTRGRIAQDKYMRQMPVRIVADGVVTRTVRDTAVFFREAEKIYRPLNLPPVGDIVGPSRKRLRIAVVVDSIANESDAETRAAVLEVASLLESLGHRIEQVDVPVPASFVEDFSVYWALLAAVLVRGGRRSFGPTFDPERLENLTVGLSRFFTRNLHRFPLAVTRLAASKHVSARFFRRHDVVLTPTLSHTTPEIGYLDPELEFEEVFGRLKAWAGFTPLQNATGDPAMSLPLARTASGLPLGLQVAARQGGEATLLHLAYELEEARPFARIQDA